MNWIIGGIVLEGSVQVYKTFKSDKISANCKVTTVKRLCPINTGCHFSYRCTERT